MTAVPALTAVTTPAATVATAALPVVHVTFWLVALVGAMVAVSVSVAPTVSVAADLLSDTPVTATVAAVTVNVRYRLLRRLAMTGGGRRTANVEP